MHSAPCIKSSRLSLRPTSIEDAQAIFAYRSDPEVNKYYNWIPEKLQDVVDFLQKCPTEFNKPDTWFQFVILLNETNEIIGDVGIHFVGEENQQVELGCSLKTTAQGQGYAFELIRELINFVFVEMDKHWIFLSIDPQNDKSIHLAERLGFRKEAHFKESMLIKEKWVDDMIYGMLNREWTNPEEK